MSGRHMGDVPVVPAATLPAEPADPIRRHLADGREILYFDERAGRPRTATDTRPLGPIHTEAQLRRDPLLGVWSVVAAHRQGRTFLPPADECPLCPSRDGRLTEVPEPSYDVVAFENRFPSLAGSGEAAATDETDETDETDDPTATVSAPGYGRCEVIVPTDDHDQSVGELPVRRLRLLVDVWAHRSDELARRPDTASVGLFENRGEAVGVTLHHTHQQVYAYPFVPPITRRLADSVERHRARTGGCLVCDRRELEVSRGERVVVAGQRWTVFVPYAARWPFEVQVVPHRHLRGLPDLDDAERDELAAIWGELFRRYDSLFDLPRLPTIAAWHQTPAGAADGHLFAQAFTLQRDTGKLKYVAGSESAFGAWILDVSPERAAEALRAAG
jgi:UDPglucose--hexose-1-phosphate uridylyltransferase